MIKFSIVVLCDWFTCPDAAIAANDSRSSNSSLAWKKYVISF